MFHNPNSRITNVFFDLHNVSKTRDYIPVFRTPNCHTFVSHPNWRLHSVLNFQLHSVFLCAQTKQPNCVLNTCLIHCLRENSTFVNLSTCQDLFRKLSRSIQKLLDHSVYQAASRTSQFGNHSRKLKTCILLKDP